MKAYFVSFLAFVVAAACAMADPETALKLTSGDFISGGTIPARYTCDGSNDTPSLRISQIPAETKSLALVMDDVDAPTGTVTHWIAWNITPDTTEFIPGSVPNGVIQGTNDTGKTGYTGPCPTSGEHRYFFRLYALNIVPELSKAAVRSAFDEAIAGHILGEATLQGNYAKKPAQ